jgi:beta-lactamase superfamily II metal-dependent hydrolase
MIRPRIIGRKIFIANKGGEAMPEFDYVSSDTPGLYKDRDGKEKMLELLWGDRVRVLEKNGSWAKVKARGTQGWVKTKDLGGKSLLEVYFIDVGQGDGILIRTPDGRHVLIDGGNLRSKQDTGKNAADFVDWKFEKDYEAKRIEIDAVIASHCDLDHYGGLWDLLNPATKSGQELRLQDVRVEAFYHAGISWWKKGKDRWLGQVKDAPQGQFYTDILEDRDALDKALSTSGSKLLAGEWAKFLKCVRDARNKADDPCPIKRLRHQDGYVPGFEPAAGGASLKVLAPVEFDVNGAAGVHCYDKSNTSINTNGNSVLLRLDYGKRRILLTGDLNEQSQAALLEDYAGREDEFKCDVAKACHHGSDKVSMKFLQAMNPAITVFSSGDNEGYDHPRPGIVAASAVTGRQRIKDDKIITPLIYSTEMARSYKLKTPSRLIVPGKKGEEKVSGAKLKNYKLEIKKSSKAVKTLALNDALVVAGLVYGLVNVRTDGEKILCATLSEKDQKWNLRKVEAQYF